MNNWGLWIGIVSIVLVTVFYNFGWFQYFSPRYYWRRKQMKSLHEMEGPQDDNQKTQDRNSK